MKLIACLALLALAIACVQAQIFTLSDGSTTTGASSSSGGATPSTVTSINGLPWTNANFDSPAESSSGFMIVPGMISVLFAVIMAFF